LNTSKNLSANKTLPISKTQPTSRTPPTGKTLTEGQRSYEAKRAAKAGMSLDKWLASKQRQLAAEEREKQKVAEAAKPPKKPGLISRLLDRAHRPLKSSR
jgi:hypothetical protein